MSKLTAYGRAHVARKNFALPRHRGEPKSVRGHYPIEDRAHARNALARGAQMVRRGKLTRAEYATIRRKVHARYPGIKMSRPALSARRRPAHPTRRRRR